jgi:HSP20 family protein
MGLPAKNDPFGDMRRLQKEMDDMFAAFFERGRDSHALMEWGPRVPLADIEDLGDSLKVSLEMPGLEKEDIKISVDKDSVEISAERKKAQEEKKKNYYHCERSYSSFRRMFGLPEEVDPDSVDAEYRDGVLRVTLKKAGKKEEKKEVKVK